MTVRDVIEKADSDVVVLAPAYNKTGSRYADYTVQIGAYTKDHMPTLSVANADVLQFITSIRHKTTVVADI